MSFTNDFENEVLDAMLGASATLLGSTVSIALFTADPGEAASEANEVSGGSYARQSVTNDGTNWPAASSGEKANGEIIDFPTATADWGTVTHWALFDGVDMKMSGVLDNGSGTPTSKTVETGDDFSFPVGQLRITLD